MKNKYIWLVGSFVIALSLVLASCSAASTSSTSSTLSTSQAAAVTTTLTPKTAIEVAALATTTTTTAATTAASESQPQYGGEYTLALAAQQTSFDTDITTWSGGLIEHLTHNTLIGGDWAKGPEGDNTADFDTSTPMLSVNIGNLASSWQLVGNNTIVFTIRQGVHFGLNQASAASQLVNGRELTADDVAYTIRRQFNIEPTVSLPNAYALTRMTAPERPITVVATDKHTVTITGTPGYIGSLFYWLGEMVGINAPEIVQKYGDMTNPWNDVGTGPFLFSDYVQNSSLTAIRNPNYYEKNPVGAGKGDQLPYLDKVKFLIIPDPSTQLAAFRTGKLDVLTTVALDDYKVLIRNNSSLQSKKLITNPDGLAMRVDNTALPTSNLQVRQALQLGLDRQTIAKNYFEGQAEILDFPVPPRRLYKTLGIYRDLNTLPADVQALFQYNPTQAKQLLAQAGYPNGFTLQVVLKQSQVDEASLLVNQLAAIGVTLTLSVQQDAVYTSISSGRTYTQGIFATGLGNTPQAFHNFRPTDSGNLSYINDDTVNQLIANFANYFMIDDSKAWPLIGDATPYILRQSWYLALPAPYTFTVWWPQVKNFDGELALSGGDFYSYPRYIWINQN
jgi:peptide/nickel transport system substrate-binding protein